MPSAVTGFHRLAIESMEKLDPRFSILIDVVGGLPSFRFHAKQPVPLTVKISPSAATEFRTKINSLIKHGDEMVMNGESIKIEGSPLLMMQMSDNAQIVFSSAKRSSATLRFGCIGPSGTLTFGLGEAHGEIVGGSQSFTFNGTALGGILVFALTIFPDDAARNKMDLIINVRSWAGQSVHLLPHFERAYEIYDSAFNCGGIALCLDAGGSELARGSGRMRERADSSLCFATVLRHLRNVRHLFCMLKMDANFEEGLLIKSDDLEFTDHIYRVMTEHEGRLGEEIGSQLVSFTCGPGGEQEKIYSLLARSGEAFQIVEELDYPGEIFGRRIGPLMLYTTYTKVNLSIAEPQKFAQLGQACEFELHPLEGCRVVTKLAEGRLESRLASARLK